LNHFLGKISFRYLFKKGTKKLSSQTILTTTGVGLGTAVLIVVLSVMNGFENELQKRILGVIPHVTIEKIGGFEDFEQTKNKVLENKSVSAVSPYLSTQIVINNNDVSKGIVLKGTSEENEISIIPNNMILGDLSSLNRGANIILGESLAYELGVALNDSVNLLSINQTNALVGIPRVISFNVSGIFSVGSEVDQNYALIGSESFLKLIKPKNGVGIEIRVNDVLVARNIGHQILKDLNTDGYMKFTSWDQLYGGLFRAVQLEKTMVGLLMSLILLVAILSLLMSINNLIKSNEKEIAILSTMGYSNNQIQRIFLQLIFTIGIFGIILGNILGLIVAANITEVLNFMSVAFNISMLDVYYLDYFPSIISFEQILIINFVTIVLLTLFGLIPARNAANTNPVKIVNSA
tara:strand:+ start:15849 stop:17069 length:1221 start_codon:yes stop_codon:yes gene_type:complete